MTALLSSEEQWQRKATRIVKALENHRDFGGYRKEHDTVWLRVWETHYRKPAGYYRYRLHTDDNFHLDGCVQRLSGVDPIAEPVFVRAVRQMLAHAAGEERGTRTPPRAFVRALQGGEEL